MQPGFLNRGLDLFPSPPLFRKVDFLMASHFPSLPQKEVAARIATWKDPDKEKTLERLFKEFSLSENVVFHLLSFKENILCAAHLYKLIEGVLGEFENNQDGEFQLLKALYDLKTTFFTPLCEASIADSFITKRLEKLRGEPVEKKVSFFKGIPNLYQGGHTVFFRWNRLVVTPAEYFEQLEKGDLTADYLFRKKAEQEKISLNTLEEIEKLGERGEFALEKSYPFWEHYVSRASLLSKHVLDLYNNQDQQEYGAFLDQTVRIAAHCLSVYKWSPFLLLNFCAKRRQEIALKREHQHKHLVGVPPCFIVLTYCNQCYGGVARSLRKINAVLKESPSPFYLNVNKEHFLSLFPSITGEKIKEIKAVSYPYKGTKRFLSFLIFKTQQEVTIAHPPADKLNEFGAELLEELIAKSLQTEDKEKLFAYLGEIFWWICQLKPWSLGDPSIAEMFIKTIYLHKTGKRAPRWAEGIIPWGSAMVEFNPEKFGENFKDLFEKEGFNNSDFW